MRLNDAIETLPRQMGISKQAFIERLDRTAKKYNITKQQVIDSMIAQNQLSKKDKIIVLSEAIKRGLIEFDLGTKKIRKVR